MKTMKRLALASLMLLLSACGGGEGGGKSEPATARTGASAGAVSDLRKVLSTMRAESAPFERTAADQLMDFAQSSTYSSLFPGNPSTQSYPPFQYRAYSNGIVLGVVVSDGMGYPMNGVYAMGGVFGDAPVYVGLLSDFITPTDPDALLTFSPRSIELSAYSGESGGVTITIEVNKPITERVNFSIVDKAGVFESNMRLVKTSDWQARPLKYVATLMALPSLPLGAHTGTVEVRLCLDDAKVCAKHYPGSPWHVPYRINVANDTNLKPLRALPGASAWSTFQGNASHNGYVPAEVDPAVFSRRFAVPGLGTTVSVDEGRLVSSVAHISKGPWSVRALSEDDGRPLWTASLGAVAYASPPGVSSGRVFLTTMADGENNHFWTLDARTGTQITRLQMTPNARGAQQAPTSFSGAVYVKSNQNGGISRFDLTGLRSWAVANVLMPSVSETSMAVNDEAVYACGYRDLYALDATTGRLRASIRSGGTLVYTTCTPVLDNAGSVYMTRRMTDSLGRIERYDLARGRLAWAFDGPFQSAPVVAHGMVYVNSLKKLEARSPSTGDIVWSWPAPSDATRDLLVVGNHAFVGTTSATYAVDLRTRKTVWSYPASGGLAVSANGILYINHANGLVAINLH